MRTRDRSCRLCLVLPSLQPESLQSGITLVIASTAATASLTPGGVGGASQLSLGPLPLVQLSDLGDDGEVCGGVF